MNLETQILLPVSKRLRTPLLLSLSFFLFAFAHAQTGTEGFYKDLFIDAGVYLSFSGHQEADSLGLSYEHVSGEDAFDQNRTMVSNSIDLNGALLYPDGSPRFRLLYTNGGYGNHGATLTSQGRGQIRHFFMNGGSYVGSCNGAALSGDGPDEYRLWTCGIYGTGVGNETTVVPTTHDIPPGSPVRNYYTFPNRLYNIAHSGGYYFPGPPAGTEILATYDSTYTTSDSGSINLDGQPGVVAYKYNDSQGRLVVSGSHPEYASPSYSDAKHLMESFYLYALEGIGKPRLKSTLTNGVAHHVDEVSPNIPMQDYSNYERIKIGDKQYHHFKMTVISGQPYLTVTLNGAAGYHLNLYARPGNEKVFASNAVHSEVSVGSDKLLLIANPSPGTWHFSVECKTSVTAIWKPLEHRYSYLEDVPGVLNGVGYSLLAASSATAPTVGIAGLAASYCVGDPATTLTGTPAGGTFSGPGIVGSTFDPAIAGVGTHTITYTWYQLSSTQQVTVDAATGPAPVISGPSHLTLGVGLTNNFLADGHPDVEDYTWTIGNAPYFNLLNYIFDQSGRKIGIRAGFICSSEEGGSFSGAPAPPIQNVTVTCSAIYCGGTQVIATHLASYDVAEYLFIGDPCSYQGGKKTSWDDPKPASLTVSPNPSSGSFLLQSTDFLSPNRKVIVRDVLGKVIYQAFPEESGHRMQIDLGPVPGGIYFVQAMVGSQMVSKRLLVH